MADIQNCTCNSRRNFTRLPLLQNFKEILGNWQESASKFGAFSFGSNDTFRLSLFNKIAFHLSKRRHNLKNEIRNQHTDNIVVAASIENWSIKNNYSSAFSFGDDVPFINNIVVVASEAIYRFLQLIHQPVE